MSAKEEESISDDNTDSEEETDDDDYSEYTSTEESECDIIHNCTRKDIVIAYIHYIETYFKLSIPHEITEICSSYFRYLPYINSEILRENEKHSLIKLFLDKQTYLSSKKMKFNLLFNAKQYDFSASKFHEICDNAGSVLTIIENNYGNVFGVYSSKAWDKSNKCDFVQEFFIFKLRSLRKQFSDHWHSDAKIMYNLDKPKIFEPQWGGYPEYLENYGPCFTGCAYIRIKDKCNKTNDNLCGHYYDRCGGNLGFEICGATELGGSGCNSLNEWDFTVINYEVFTMENEYWKKYKSYDTEEDEYEEDEYDED